MESSQMICAKFVAQLHNLPETEGVITAFTSFGKHVFVGTSLGFIQVYRISVRPTSEKQIYTTLTSKVCLIEKKKVSRLFHSSNKDVIFSLCGKRIFVLNSKTMEIVRTFQEGVSDFWVSSVGGQESSLHIITCALQARKEVIVLEYDSEREKEDIINTLILPELVQQVVEYNGIVCLGMRREYSMLSVFDGDSKSLLALTGNATPMLSFGGSDVFMRLGETVFVVSMKHLPSSGSALKTTIRFPEEPRALVYAHPFLFGFCKSFCNVYSWYDGDIVEELPMEDCCFASPNVDNNTIYCASKNKFWLVRTVPLEHQLEQLVSKGKIDQSFDLLRSQPVQSKNEAVQRTDSLEATNPNGPLNNMLFVEANLNVMVGFMYLYNNSPLEAIGHFGSFVDVREPLLHLPDLLPMRRRRPQIEHWLRSFHHSSFLKARNRGSNGSSACAIPAIFHWCAEAGASVERLRLLSMTCHDDDDESDIERVFWSGFKPRHPHSRLWNLYFNDSSEESTPNSHSSPTAFPKGPAHSNGSPSSSAVREVLTSAWASAFYRDGEPLQSSDARRSFDPNSLFSNLTGYQGGLISLTLEEYLCVAEDRLKEELVRWLSSRLATCPPTQRRAAEFALFTLYVQANDRRSLYLLASTCEFVLFADVWELLSSPLAYTLSAHGETCPSDDLVTSPLPSNADRDEAGCFGPHDIVSRCVGMDISAGEWRILYLLLLRQLGLDERKPRFGPPSMSPNRQLASSFFRKYLSIRQISQRSAAILESFGSQSGAYSGFSSDNENDEEEDALIKSREAQRKNVLLSTQDRNRAYSIAEPSIALNKGRQWPLLLRDYVEACRALYCVPMQAQSHLSYPSSMHIDLQMLPDLMADVNVTSSRWAFRRHSTHELFFAIESGDSRYVAEALVKQQQDHVNFIEAHAHSIHSSGPSCWITVDDEGNNAFHILFALLLSASANSALSHSSETVRHADIQKHQSDITQQTHHRRARQLKSNMLRVPPLDASPDQGCDSSSLHLDTSSHDNIGPASKSLSVDTSMAILCVLLSHGCSEVGRIVIGAAETSREHGKSFSDDQLLVAFQESLGCALACPSSLLMLIMPNDDGITPLQLIETFPSGSLKIDSRFKRDPNAHTFEMVVSFILAQLRVLTVPE